MTGRRKSCKTCKKTAASSLPFMETSVPVGDGFFYQNDDHEENRTPDFRSRTADATSEPATPSDAIADPALGRTEQTPGFRKTGKRKAFTQASSFTAVAQQTTQQIGADKGDKVKDDNEANDNGDGTSKDSIKDSPCGDKKDPADAAGCSDQHAPKSAVAVSVAADTPAGARAAPPTAGSIPAPAVGVSDVAVTVTPTAIVATKVAVDVRAGDKPVLRADNDESSSTDPDVDVLLDGLQDFFTKNADPYTETEPFTGSMCIFGKDPFCRIRSFR